MVKKLALVIVSVFLITVLVSGCTSNSTSANKEPIRIGFIAGMSGPNAELGNGQKMAIELAVEQWNKKGGIDGRKIELIERDDHYNPTDTVNAANELINNYKVVAIVGPTGSGNAKALLPVVKAAGIPLMITNSMDNEFTNPVIPNVYRFAMPNWVQEQMAIDYALKNNMTRIAVINDTSGYGKPGGDEIVKMLKEKGITPVAREEYKPGDLDVTAQVLRIKNANPQILIIWGMAADAANIRKTMVANGLNIPMIGGNPLVMKSYRDIAGSAIGETITTYLDTYLRKPFRPEAIEFAKAWKEKYPNDKVFYGPGDEPWYYLNMPAQTYDAVNVLLTAIKNAKSTDSKKIIEELDKIRDYKGVTNKISFSPDDHDAQGPENNVYCYVTQDGVFELKMEK